MLKYRIMITDDEDDNVQILRSYLEPEYEVVTATDGIDTLEKLDAVEPDLFLLDIMMPIMSGFDTCEALRRHPRYQKTPVIFISSLDSRQDIMKSFALGGSFFISKPFSADRIRKNVALTLASAPPAASKRFTLEDLADIERDRLWRAIPPAGAASPRPSGLPPAATAQDAAPEGPDTEKPRIMIVDDDEDIRIIIGESFSNRFEVLSAVDGREALSRIMDVEPDILLLDIAMPRVNGFELCVALRRTSRFKRLPILFLSANNSQESMEKARKAGGTAFLAKPCSIQDLSQALFAVVDAPGFEIGRKRNPIEALINDDRLREEQARAQAARQSVDREFGELREFIQRHFMEELR